MNKKPLIALSVVGVIALVLSTRSVVALQQARITFFEGNDCTQNVIGTHDSFKDADVRYLKDGKHRGWNDEIRSLLIQNDADAQFWIYLHDDPKGRTNDDWAIVEYSGSRPVCVSSFNRTDGVGLGNSLLMIVRKCSNDRYDGKLDGKVSYIEVSYSRNTFNERVRNCRWR